MTKKSKSKIGIIGSNGQIGRSICRLLSKKYHIYKIPRSKCDLYKQKKTINHLKKNKYDILINAAAFTNVDKCEIERKKSEMINSKSLFHISKICKKNGTLLIHYSTDYVFNGKKKLPYNEKDKCDPINHYGKTKLLGEQIIQNSGCIFLILRTSWVYGPNGRNFINKIVEKINLNENLKVISDQYGVPNSSEFIADMTAALIKNKIKNEIINVTSDGKTSWYQLSKEILKYLKLKKDIDIKIEKITSKQANFIAKRPLYSKLSNQKLKKFVQNKKILSWEKYFKKYISNSKNFYVN